MVTEHAVEAIILEALHCANEMARADEKFEVNIETKLLGVDSPLDSLALITLVSDVESEVNAKFDRTINLMSSQAMERAESPFSSGHSLKSYILEVLNVN